MPTIETYNPSRAAKQVGVPGSTLRNWARVYAEFLSPGSNPEPGTERRFTDGDVETLHAVAQLRANGLEPGEIVARLRDNPAAGQQQGLQSILPALDAAGGANLQPGPLESIIAVSVGKVDGIADKLEAVDRRLERVESQRSMILIAVLAFAAGVVLVAVIAWLVVSLMR